MSRVLVNSKNLAEIDYSLAQKTLKVVFVNAPSLEYTYSGVEASLYIRLLAAESKGEFFAQEIRGRPGRYPYTIRRI